MVGLHDLQTFWHAVYTACFAGCLSHGVNTNKSTMSQHTPKEPAAPPSNQQEMHNELLCKMRLQQLSVHMRNLCC